MIRRRRWADLRLRTKAIIVLSIPLVPLLASVAVIMVTARQERVAQDWVTHTLQVKAQIATAHGIVVDAEAATREYILTREPEAMTRLAQFGAEWPTATQRLLALIIDNPEEVQHGREMAKFRDERPLATLLEYVRDRPSEPSPPAEMLRRSRVTLAAVRGELMAMQAVEDRLLTTRVALVKPVDFREFVDAVKLLGGFWAVVNEPPPEDRHGV